MMKNYFYWLHTLVGTDTANIFNQFSNHSIVFVHIFLANYIRIAKQNSTPMNHGILIQPYLSSC